MAEQCQRCGNANLVPEGWLIEHVTVTRGAEEWPEWRCRPPDPDDEGYDDRWLCDGCGGSWSDPDDDLTVGLRYQCAECGEITTATSSRPWLLSDQ